MKTEILVALITGGFGIVGLFIKFYLDEKKNHHNLSKVKLKYHPLFTRIEAQMTYLQLNLSLENKGKEAIMKDLLTNKFKIWHDELLELAKEIDTCVETCSMAEEECNKLYNMNMKFFNQAVTKYTNYYKTSDYNRNEQKALDLVMSKFNKWHEARVNYVQQAIQSICNSKFYGDCKTRQAVIFDIYTGALADTLTDAERTLNDINGDLSGLKFRGITI